MISREEVKHIAKLARLELTEIEIEKMQKDLSSILDYVDILKKAPLAKNKQGSRTRSGGTATRKDVADSKPASLANALVQAAPDKKDGYIKVKSIL